MGDYTTKMMRAGEGKPVWMQLQAYANEYWFKLEDDPYQHLILKISANHIEYRAHILFVACGLGGVNIYIFSQKT